MSLSAFYCSARSLCIAHQGIELQIKKPKVLYLGFLGGIDLKKRWPVRKRLRGML